MLSVTDNPYLFISSLSQTKSKDPTDLPNTC